MAYLGDPNLPAPPSSLVPLDSLPRDAWVGRRVWHPGRQAGGVPHWRDEDDPSAWAYDFGVVTEIVPPDAPYANHPDDPPRVHFKPPGDNSGWAGLHYSADNLWTEAD